LTLKAAGYNLFMDDQRRRSKTMYCPNPDCPDFKETGVPGEYIEGVTICPFCGSNLVEQIPDTRPEEDRGEAEEDEDESSSVDDLDEDLVAVASYNVRQDAELMITFLISRGIDVFESPDDCGGTDPAIGFATRTRLLVPASQAEEASALIKEAEKDQ
jgi:hypothetical protein